MKTFDVKVGNNIYVLSIKQNALLSNPIKTPETIGMLIGEHKELSFAFHKRANHTTSYKNWNAWAKQELQHMYFYVPVFVTKEGGQYLLSVEPITKDWDTKQIGFYAFTREDMDELTGSKRLSEKVRTELTMYVEQTLINFENWLNDRVYEIIVQENEQKPIIADIAYLNRTESQEDFCQRVIAHVISRGFNQFKSLLKNNESTR